MMSPHSGAWPLVFTGSPSSSLSSASHTVQETRPHYLHLTDEGTEVTPREWSLAPVRQQYQED